MTTKTKGIGVILAAIVLLGGGCVSAPRSNQQTAQPQQNTPLVGTDRDAHGCIGSAGYSWCEVKQKCLRTWEEKCEEPKPDIQTITYLTSKEETTKFCDGSKMNSEGYKKTITQKVSAATTTISKSENELIKTTLLLATTGMCQNIINQLNITVADGVVTIPSVDGFAGVSIVMCSCKPQVEVNLLQIPGIKKVIWK